MFHQCIFHVICSAHTTEECLVVYSYKHAVHNNRPINPVAKCACLPQTFFVHKLVVYDMISNWQIREYPKTP